ncbi:MAG: vitamin B12-dependent ribonucleotide reductase, partial [Phycisphaerales bacterium]|nr:vitamin B12-dependent ribonucleotide reductase [Phycisphaerales bacterium]
NAGRIGIANADDLLDHAVRAWDEALTAGDKYGYRNAQVTVIAPTGTIGLLMDCDTTGIEPDFALVKFKKLAGGGYFKIANASVKPALEAMGYGTTEIQDILTYLLGTLNVDVPLPGPDGSGYPHAPRGDSISFKQWLMGKGLTEADITKLNDALPGVFELGFAFNAWTLGDDAIARLGLDPARTKSDHTFNLLRELGLTRKQTDALNETICGRQTVEGAPLLRETDLPVFDCANKCGKHGVRFIAPYGHIRMMAAAQPFISGAISKTINLPNDASVQDIKDCYRLSWELGLKANALYRDGCKLSQPLNSSSDTKEEEPAQEKAAEAKAAPALPLSDVPAEVEPLVRIVERPMRRRLPDTRASITHKFNIAGHEGYITVGLYEDGTPGELFITMAKEGSTIGGMMDSLGTAISVALQYGVPVESLVNKFTHQRFEPAGMTANRDIPFAKSFVDYIFRW